MSALAPAAGFFDTHAAVADHVFPRSRVQALAVMIVVLRPATFVRTDCGSRARVSPRMLGYAAWLHELIAGVVLVTRCASATGLGTRIRIRHGTAAERVTSVIPVMAHPSNPRP